MASDDGTTVLLADVSGSLVLATALGVGDAEVLECASQVKRQVARFKGRVVKATETTIIASFPAPVSALAAARAMQKVCDDANKRRGDDVVLGVRIAIDAGAASAKDAAGGGPGVAVCVKAAAMAHPNQVLMTQRVFASLPTEEQEHCRPLERKLPGNLPPIYEVISDDRSTARAGQMWSHAERRLRLTTTREDCRLGRERPTLRLGRGAKNDVVLTDEFVSREHAVIKYRQGQFYLTDKSSNGTLIAHEGGIVTFVHRERTVLAGQGRIRLGHLEGQELPYVVETLSATGDAWAVEAVTPLRPASAPRQESALKLEGEYWTLAHAGAVLRFRDVKGLHYLAHLLGHPGQEFHALDLAELIGGALESTPARADHREREEPVLDAAAKAAYKRRITEVREELAEAERLNDAGRIAALTEEQELITRQLATAVGLGGRDRTAATNAERARVTVTLAIKSVLKKIGRVHPVLGAHLNAAIKTGRFCSYVPDTGSRVSWLT
jgi:pSer/pThr/pTyr-binding forkhead associated (FHA) protein